MTEFNLNTEFKNNRPRATETNRRNDNGNGKKKRESAKSPDFFVDNNVIKKIFFF